MASLVCAQFYSRIYYSIRLHYSRRTTIYRARARVDATGRSDSAHTHKHSYSSGLQRSSPHSVWRQAKPTVRHIARIASQSNFHIARSAATSATHKPTSRAHTQREEGERERGKKRYDMAAEKRNNSGAQTAGIICDTLTFRTVMY